MTRELLQQALDALLHSDSPSQKRTDAITALKQALAAPQPEPWMPIETAPKDGGMFLVWISGVRYGEDENGQQYQQEESQVDFAQWRTFEDGGYVDCFGNPYPYDQWGATHWMPLPAAPGAAPPAAPAPGDMVMVPMQPTEDMIQAAAEAWDATPGMWDAFQAAIKAAIAAAPAPAVPNIVNPITDADLDRIADAVPVDDIGVHITTWHRRFARAVLSAAPAVREPKPAELLGMAVVDAIVDDGMRNAAGGIYATRVQEFAREVQIAFAQQNRVDLSGIGGGGNG